MKAADIAEILKALDPILGEQPGWVLVTLAAILATAVILRGGTLAEIVKSINERAMHKASIELMRQQLFKELAGRPDVKEVRIEIPLDNIGERGLGPGRGKSESATGESS